MTVRTAIGIDIGGTKIAFVLVSNTGEALATYQLPTGVEQGTEIVFERISQGIAYLLDKADAPIDGIGIGSPGNVNPITGVVSNAVNLKWAEVALRDEVRKRLPAQWAHLPIEMQKDTNAEAIGELQFGAAQGSADFMYVAIGTGLGGGAISGGHLIDGGFFYATEIGHLSLDPTGRLCACGLHGCPEMYISGNGLAAAVREHRSKFPTSPLANDPAPTTSTILNAMRAGDPLGLLILNEAGRWLGAIVACCVGILNPKLLVIGGGIGRSAMDLLWPLAEVELRKRLIPPLWEQLRVEKSQIASTAVGAACLVWQKRS